MYLAPSRQLCGVHLRSAHSRHAARRPLRPHRVRPSSFLTGLRRESICLAGVHGRSSCQKRTIQADRLPTTCSAILAAFFLGERLGKIGISGCSLCLVGSIVIVLHAPEDKEIATVDEMLEYALQPGAYRWSFVMFGAHHLTLAREADDRYTLRLLSYAQASWRTASSSSSFRST